MIAGFLNCKAFMLITTHMCFSYSLNINSFIYWLLIWLIFINLNFNGYIRLSEVSLFWLIFINLNFKGYIGLSDFFFLSFDDEWKSRSFSEFWWDGNLFIKGYLLSNLIAHIKSQTRASLFCYFVIVCHREHVKNSFEVFFF